MSVLPTPDAINLTLPHPTTMSNAATASAPRGRASWSGLLRLSLVTVPVKAYPAIASGQESHFHQLHAGCGQRVRYEKRCPDHGPLDAGAIAKGYPYAPDLYLVLDDAELDKLRPAKDKALTLEHFVDPNLIDPALFAGRSLYLLPDGPAAHHPYLVLSQALQQRRRWALGRVVLGSQRHPVLVRPAGRLLTVHVLHYPALLRPGAALEAELRGGTASEEESKLAALLIDAASPAAVPWPDYRDDSAEQLAALVDAKLQGRPLASPTAEDMPVLRLLDALKRSVAEATQQPGPVAAATAAPGQRKRGKKSPRRSA